MGSHTPSRAGIAGIPMVAIVALPSSAPAICPAARATSAPVAPRAKSCCTPVAA